jgi:hypothetical protein
MTRVGGNGIAGETVVLEALLSSLSVSKAKVNRRKLKNIGKAAKTMCRDTHS